MPDIAPTTPTIGELNSTADPKILTALQTIVARINDLDSDNITDFSLDQDTLTAAMAQYLGISQTGTVRRGKVVTAGEETTTSASYTTLTTPDRVSSVVLPTDGLIHVLYSARWKESVNNTAKAAVFLGANQLVRVQQNNAANVVQEAGIGGGGASIYNPLVTTPSGLVSGNGSGTSIAAPATTGQLVGFDPNTTAFLTVGGVLSLFAAAGTYDVSVQFKTSSGTVSVNNRKLWVWTQSF